MKSINTYLIEKLFINKDIKISKEDKFLIVYSEGNTLDVKIFDTYQESKKFIKIHYYYDGYVSKNEEHLLYIKRLILNSLNNDGTLKDDALEKLAKYVEDNDIQSYLVYTVSNDWIL